MRRAQLCDVPAGTELDLFQGRALVSLVAFHFGDNRALGVPIPFARDYDQVNLRFYVRRLMPDGTWRRGDAVVARALRLIEEGYLADESVSALAARVGLSERQLRRLFVERLGA